LDKLDKPAAGMFIMRNTPSNEDGDTIILSLSLSLSGEKKKREKGPTTIVPSRNFRKFLCFYQRLRCMRADEMDSDGVPACFISIVGGKRKAPLKN